MSILHSILHRLNSSCSRQATVNKLSSSAFDFTTSTSTSSRKNFGRRMSDHLDRTAHNFRQPGISNATVTELKEVSPSVKFLTLKVANPNFHFKAGQWVDFFISGVRTVGGYSMCTSPKLLRTDSQLGLVIKYSEYAPAFWVHTKCEVGDVVGVRVGGDQINYDPSPGDPSWDVLLLAGGIGINPMYSILQQVRDLHQERMNDPTAYKPGKVELLYSASSMKELIFKESIEAIASGAEDINCHFFVTKEKITPSTHISDKRIDSEAIATAIQRLDKENLRCFICGPPPMIADIETHLEECGIREDQIHCEKWW
ncbi:oxidoreductase NAD-binding domain-containing protein 1-like isoform X2 [Asterias rubens]|uniref:oxidoreductase NAD-binding domain-containing protein 1-like isoform X2 n=1 Tax=Asterias rubens TaxID=7604 RepID=UPI00145553B8|nr:oxidoreductase NAD-binding domain-containing protein 1-like isoform X2 [Asterias rubens]